MVLRPEYVNLGSCEGIAPELKLNCSLSLNSSLELEAREINLYTSQRLSRFLSYFTYIFKQKNQRAQFEVGRFKVFWFFTSESFRSPRCVSGKATVPPRFSSGNEQDSLPPTTQVQVNAQSCKLKP